MQSYTLEQMEEALKLAEESIDELDQNAYVFHSCTGLNRCRYCGKKMPHHTSDCKVETFRSRLENIKKIMGVKSEEQYL